MASCAPWEKITSFHHVFLTRSAFEVKQSPGSLIKPSWSKNDWSQSKREQPLRRKGRGLDGKGPKAVGFLQQPHLRLLSWSLIESVLPTVSSAPLSLSCLLRRSHWQILDIPTKVMNIWSFGPWNETTTQWTLSPKATCQNLPKTKPTISEVRYYLTGIREVQVPSL